MPNFQDPEISWFLDHYTRILYLCDGLPGANEILLYSSKIELLVKFELFIDILIAIRDSHSNFIKREAEQKDG